MTEFRRAIGVSAVLLAAAASGACGQDASSPQPWLDDFETLKRELGAGYANLEWAARDQGIDLPALARETEAKLSATLSRRKARGILLDFLESFADPHLTGETADAPFETATNSGEWSGPPMSASGKQALDAFGYRSSSSGFGVRLDALDGFEALPTDDNPFPAGVLALPDGRKLGLIRIEYFGEDRYYDVARAQWETFRAEWDGDCGNACWWAFTLGVRSRLMEHLRDRVSAIRSSGARDLLVDITGNGGGSEWCEDVAQSFTSKALPGNGVGLVKHAHWERQLERELASLDEDLARDDLDPELRSRLEEATTAHRALLDDVRAGCDPEAVWSSDAAGRSCDRLARDRHGTFAVPAGAETIASELASEWILFTPSRHPEFVGTWTGGLFVAIDGGTASASEQFASLLQSNGAATIVGETSYGAGCGYTGGGIRLYLENVGLRVRMPDCVRYRADGENERAGVVPDRAGWSPGAKGKTRARELRAVLAELMEK